MRAARLVALFEILLCSDFPTQIAIGATLRVFGILPKTAHGDLSVRYVVALSLADTALLIGLILFLLRSHGERPRDVFLGPRPIAGEFKLGLSMTLAVFVIAIAVLGGVQLLAPVLHNVPQNPLQDMLRRPRDAGLFAVVVVIAGGVREEIQRAFILHRFDEWLGGAYVGVVVWSLAFGFGHLLQGYDVAIATALMGAFWAIVYVRRRSVVAPLVSHSGFNLLELAQYLAARRYGL
jgi:membrane protease YdiL (CAAX protease family)